MQQIITAKEFRLQFPKICDRVEKGESFLLIRRSKPIMRLTPPHSPVLKKFDWVEDLKKIRDSLEINKKKMKINAVALIRKERD